MISMHCEMDEQGHIDGTAWLAEWQLRLLCSSCNHCRGHRVSRLDRFDRRCTDSLSELRQMIGESLECGTVLLFMCL